MLITRPNFALVSFAVKQAFVTREKQSVKLGINNLIPLHLLSWRHQLNFIAGLIAGMLTQNRWCTTLCGNRFNYNINGIH